MARQAGWGGRIASWGYESEASAQLWVLRRNGPRFGHGIRLTSAHICEKFTVYHEAAKRQAEALWSQLYKLARRWQMHVQLRCTFNRYVSCPCHMHRPLPMRTHTRTQNTYKVCLTVRSSTFIQARTHTLTPWPYRCQRVEELAAPANGQHHLYQFAPSLA